MAILRSSPISFVDLSDQQKLSVYITSNLTSVQVKDSGTGTYNPDWAVTALVITPNILLDNTAISNTSNDIKIEWSRRFGNGAEVALGDAEIVKNGELTVQANQMNDNTADMLTYICRVTHTSPLTQKESKVLTQLTYTLMRTASAVTFDVYPENGTIFKDGITKLTLNTFAFDGSVEIEDAEWNWFKYLSGWQEIATGRTYTVTNDDVTNVTSYKCEMTYKGVTYSDIVTLTDKTDIYTSELRVVGGTTFHNGQGGTGVYAIVYENGVEVDPCPNGKFPSTSFPADAKNGEQFYLVDHDNQCIHQKTYDGSEEGVTTTINQNLIYTWTLMDKYGNHVTAFNKTGKVIYLSGTEIDSIGTIQCDVTKK